MHTDASHTGLRPTATTDAALRQLPLLQIAEQLAQMTFAASVFGTFAGLLLDLSDI